MKREKDYCEVDCLCPNCDMVIWFNIPMGIEAKRYLKKQRCPNCDENLEL